MVRVKYTPARKKKKKRLFRQVKGAQGGRSRLLRTAKEALRRSLYYSYRDRRIKKRNIRRLWIILPKLAQRESELYCAILNLLKKSKKPR